MCANLFLTLQGQEHIWYLDSGCSRHMTGFKSLLDDYVKKDDPVVTYGDNSKGQTKGFGTIKCKTVEFKNVSYVKGLKHNLVSISQLCDADYEVHFNKKEGKVIDSKKVSVLTANRREDIYVLDMFLNSVSHFRAIFLHIIIQKRLESCHMS